MVNRLELPRMIDCNICSYIEGFFGLAPVVTPVNNQATPENIFFDR